MVKGISRRVVVVKAPVGSIFDEAIFIMRDDSAAPSEIDEKKIIREACSAADEYVRENCLPDKSTHRKAILFSAITALLLILLFVFLLFIF